MTGRPPTLSGNILSLQRQINRGAVTPLGPVSVGPGEGQMRWYTPTGTTWQVTPSGASLPHRGTLTGLAPLLSGLHDTSDDHETRMGDAEDRLDGHDADVSRIDGVNATQDGRLTSAEGRLAGHDTTLGQHDTRITAAQGAADDAQDAADGAQSTADTARAEAGAAQDTADDALATANAAATGSEVDALRTRVAQLESNVATLSSRLTQVITCLLDAGSAGQSSARIAGTDFQIAAAEDGWGYLRNCLAGV